MAMRGRFRGWRAGLVTFGFLSLIVIASRGMQARKAIAVEPPRIAVQDAPKVAGSALPQFEKVEPTQPAPASSPFDLEPAPKVAAPASTRPSTTDDPEGSAAEFLDRSRREAGEAVKTLSAEAELLRAKLAKTEAGLKRWQNVLEALNRQIRPGNGPPLPGNPPEPEPILEPISPNTPTPVVPGPIEPAPSQPTELPRAPF
jgi:hypothetical protein